MLEILVSEVEINNRVYISNKSSIKMNGKKISYYSFLIDKTNIDCLKAICKIVLKIDINKIASIYR